MKKIALLLIAFYQKILSPLSVGSCRYYPSCSEYAKWEFTHHSFPKALLSSTLRILRCNPLFSGGIDYPVTKKVGKPPGFGIIKPVSFWYVPKGKDRYYVIKRMNK